MLSVRIVTCDHYIGAPIPELDVIYSDFRGSEVKQVPVIRIFGSDVQGQKTCLHIHGVFPYIYIGHDGQEESGKLQYQIAASLDRALNISLGKANSSVQHVYKIVLVSGKPFYGFHPNEHQYFKIYLYNPLHKKKATDLLQSGAILNKVFQTYHAHFPYMMQFLIDYNLHGMNWITLEAAKFRRDPDGTADGTVDGEDLLPKSVARSSTCRVEADGLAVDIVSVPDANPGLTGIWQDERARRLEEARPSQITPPTSQRRPDCSPTEGEVFLQLRLQEKLAAISSSQLEDSSGSSSTPTTPSLVAYPAETPTGDGPPFLDASYLDAPVPSPSRRGETPACRRADTVVDEDLVLRLTRALDESVRLDEADLALVDILQEMAEQGGGGAEEDSALGSQLPGKNDDDDDEHLRDLSQPFDRGPEPSSLVVSPNSHLWENSFWAGASPIPQSDGAEKSPKSEKGDLPPRTLNTESNINAKIPTGNHTETHQPDQKHVPSGSKTVDGSVNTLTCTAVNNVEQLGVKKKRPWVKKKTPPQSTERRAGQSNPVKLRRHRQDGSSSTSTDSELSNSLVSTPANYSSGYCAESNHSTTVYSGCSPDYNFIHSEAALLNRHQSTSPCGSLSRSSEPAYLGSSRDNTFVHSEAMLNGSQSTSPCGTLLSSEPPYSGCSPDNTSIDSEPAPLIEYRSTSPEVSLPTSSGHVDLGRCLGYSDASLETFGDSSRSVPATYMTIGVATSSILIPSHDIFVEDKNPLAKNTSAVDLNVTDVFEFGLLDDVGPDQDQMVLDGEPVQYVPGFALCPSGFADLAASRPPSRLYTEFLLGDPPLTVRVDADEVLSAGGYFSADVDRLQTGPDATEGSEYFTALGDEYRLSQQTEEIAALEPVTQAGDELDDGNDKAGAKNGTPTTSLEASLRQAARLARYEDSINQTIVGSITTEAEKTTLGLDENGNNQASANKAEIVQNSVPARSKKRSRKLEQMPKKQKKQKTMIQLDKLESEQDNYAMPVMPSLSLVLAADHFEGTDLKEGGIGIGSETATVALRDQSQSLEAQHLCADSETAQQSVSSQKSSDVPLAVPFNATQDEVVMTKCNASKKQCNAKTDGRKKKGGFALPSKSSLCVTDVSPQVLITSTVPSHPDRESASEANTSGTSVTGNSSTCDVKTGKVVLEMVGSRKRYKLTTLSSQHNVYIGSSKKNGQKVTSTVQKGHTGDVPPLPGMSLAFKNKAPDKITPKSPKAIIAPKGKGKQVEANSQSTPPAATALQLSGSVRTTHSIRECFVQLEQMSDATIRRWTCAKNSVTLSIPIVDGANQSSSSSSSSSDGTPRNEIRSPKKKPSTPKRGSYHPLNIKTKKSPSLAGAKRKCKSFQSTTRSSLSGKNSAKDRDLERMVCKSGIACVVLKPLSPQDLAVAAPSSCLQSEKLSFQPVANTLEPCRIKRASNKFLDAAISACDQTIIISESVLPQPCTSSSSGREINCDTVSTKNDQVEINTKTARKKLSFSLLNLSNRKDDKTQGSCLKLSSSRRDSVDLFCDSSSPLLSGSGRERASSDDEVGNKCLVLSDDVGGSNSTKDDYEQLNKVSFSTDDDSDDDLQILSFYNSQYCSADADYTFLVSPQATQKVCSPPVDGAAIEPSPGVKAFVPISQPPSREEVVASLRDLGIPEHRFQEPFYSNPLDATSSREVGHRVVKLATSSVDYLPPFESSLENVLSLEMHRDMVVQEFDSSQVFIDFNSKYANLRPALASQREVFITPVNLPPSFIEIDRWVKGKKLLKEEESEKQVEVSRVQRIVLPSSQGQGGECESDSDVSLTLSPETPPTRHAHSTPYVGPRSTKVPSPTLTPVRTMKQRQESRLQTKKRLTLLETLVEEEVDKPSSLANILPSSPDMFTSEFSTVHRKKNLSLRRKSNEINLSVKKASESGACSPTSPDSNSSESPKRSKTSPLLPHVSFEDRSLHKLLLQTQFRQHLATPRGASSSCEIEGVFDNTHGFKMSLENLQDARADTLYQYLTILAMEVHVQTRGDLRPDPQHDPVRALFYVVTNDVPEDHALPRQDSGVIVVDNATSVPLLRSAGVSQCKSRRVASEKDLVSELVALVREWDPDILVGYEVEMLSWGYLLQRAAVLGIDLCPQVSRVPAAKRDSRFTSAEDAESMSGEMTIVGRIVLNVWRLMRSEVALMNYSFENVTFHVLHQRVPLHSFRMLSYWWEHHTNLYRHITVEYYMLRVNGIVKLLDQLDIIGRTSELARLFGIQFYEVLSRGSQFRVESMMLRLAKPLNYVPVSPTVQQRAKMRAPESIPLIMEPKSRFYVDPVIVLDFQSLYPSIIIAYNYCYSTCLGRIEHLGSSDPFQFGCTQLKVPPSVLAKLGGNIHISPCGVAFVKDCVRTGILPRMLREILETRLMVKKSMKEHRDDKVLQRVLHSRQLGLKLIANVTYGYTAANFSGRMPCSEVGDSVVGKGRETLERAIRLVKETERWGAEVVYGDTDSMFVLCKGRSREQAFAIGAEIAEAVTMDNPTPVKLKLEKVYQPCILQTKKRYVGYMYESAAQARPTYDAKGIETVRRDGCPAVAKVLERCLRTLFETRDVSLVKRYVCRQFDKLVRGRTNVHDLIYAREYRGMAGYRPGACVPALELARQWLRTDKRAEPRCGERVPYVIVAGPPGLPLIRLVRSPHDLMADPSLKINATYYITRAIIPPLHRCFSLLGADVEAWYAEMPRRAFSYLPTDVPDGQKKSTISQYFATTSCAACGRPTNVGVCADCRARPQNTVLVLNDKIRRWERAHANITKVCQSCCGRPHSVDCKSLDCPVLFRKFQATRDLDQAPFARKLLEQYEF